MIREIIIPFSSEEGAKIFQHSLMNMGFDSRLQSRYSIRKTVEYRGTVAGFEKVLDFSKQREEKELCFGGYLMGDYKINRAFIDEYKKGVAELYEKIEIGTTFSSEEDLMNKICGCDSSNAVQDAHSDEESEKKQKKRDFMMMILEDLIINDCFESVPDSSAITLKEKKPVEGFPLSTIIDWDTSNIDPEVMEKYGVSAEITGLSYLEYTVTLGPEYLTMEENTLLDMINQAEPGNCHLPTIFETIRDNFRLVHRILDLIRAGASDIPMIKMGLLRRESYYRYQIGGVVLVKILSDLQKIGFVTMKDGSIQSAA